MSRSTAERVIIGLTIFGLLFALYSVSLHYSSDGSRLCNISETFNCDKVNKSPWSVFLGVPVAIWGTIAYLIVFALAYRKKSIQSALGFTNRDWWGYFILLTTAMLVFQGYLTLAEVLWIKAYCIACLGSQATTLGLFIASFIQWRTAK